MVNSPKDDLELKLYLKSVSGDSLVLCYSVINNLDEIRSIRIDEITTISGISTLTLNVIEKDSLPLSFYNPFPGYSGPFLYTVINPNDSIAGTILVDLGNLYTVKDVAGHGPPHKIIGRCSFQLIYYDKYLERINYKKNRGSKRVKQHKPVSDTLYSNIVFYQL